MDRRIELGEFDEIRLAERAGLYRRSWRASVPNQLLDWPRAILVTGNCFWHSNTAKERGESEALHFSGSVTNKLNSYPFGRFCDFKNIPEQRTFHEVDRLRSKTGRIF